jgi:murein DD-endopeptidase MepM/ murein hydrolase activator NlpD
MALMGMMLTGCGPQAMISTAVVIVPEETSQAPSSTASPSAPLSASPTLPPLPPSETPAPTATLTPTLIPTATIPAGYVRYETQSGETWAALAARFGTTVEEILCEEPDFCAGRETPVTLIPSGVELLIPDRVRGMEGVVVSPGNRLLPDSEFIRSLATLDFDLVAYLDNTEGYLKTHRQYLMVNGWNTGAEVVEIVARENSINPRLLLALLEYQCGCVLENPGTQAELEPFLKATSIHYLRKDLWGQLNWAVRRMWVGYAGWRDGTLTEFTLKDGTVVRPAPELNAGTVAVQYFFAFVYDLEGWQQAVEATNGFPAVWETMFGDPWAQAMDIFPAEVAQPAFILPFERGTTWSYTGGPHAAFGGNGPLAALDFAPALATQGCVLTNEWVLAVADGVVVRVETGLVVLDLDGEEPADGVEQTGWSVLYLHLEARERVALGTVVKAGDRLGHPSCEGGVANGTHVHLARKFNGEWLAADGPLPFNLAGWVAQKGEKPYLGTLHRGDEVRTACTCSWREGWIVVDE